MTTDRTWSYSLEESTGVVVAHRTDCPLVRQLAGNGEPVMTMIDCHGPLPKEIERHLCLVEEE